MGVPVGQLSAVNLRRVDLGELDFSLRRNSDQLDSPPECELLKTRGEAVVNDDRIGVEGRSCNASVELASALLHRADDVDDGSHFGVFELVEHLPHRQVLLVDVAHLDQLGQLAAWEQEVVRLPEVLLDDGFVDTYDGVFEFLFGALFLALGRTGACDFLFRL